MKTKNQIIILSFIILGLFFSSQTIQAADGINKELSYYGVMKSSSGNMVQDGNYDMVFKIYTASAGGAPIWTGNYTQANGDPVEVRDGNFTVLLGSGNGNTLNLDFSQDTYYIGITVGTDSEMLPRQRLAASAYAFNSNTVNGTGVYQVYGDPNGTQTGSAGDIAIDITDKKIYIKTSGTDTNTNWAQIGTNSLADLTDVSISSLTAGNYLVLNSQGRWVNQAPGNLTASTSGITITGGDNSVLGSGVTINISSANGSQNGLLTSTDWNTFNDKASLTDLVGSSTNGQLLYNNNGQVNGVAPASISVYDFGATCNWNGATGTDDTAAFQTAVNYALANKVRVIKVGYGCKITDVNLTNAYYAGLIFEGVSSEQDQLSSNVSQIVVSGASSQGFDLSGTDGVTFKNISFVGDKNAPPVSAIYASRTTLEDQSYGQIFDNVIFSGYFSVAAVYDYAGEGWSFSNGGTFIDSGMGFYMTSKNSIGKTSKFSTHTASGDNFLTFTEFKNGNYNSYDSSGKSLIEFEGNYVSGAMAPRSTIENINFDHNYFESAGTTGQAGSTIKLIDVSGSVVLNDDRDESFAKLNTEAPDSFLEIDSSGSNSQLIGLTFNGGAFLPQRWIVKGGNVINLKVSGTHVYANGAGAITGWPYAGLTNLPTWQFDNLQQADVTLSAAENFVVTTSGILLNIKPGNRWGSTVSQNIYLPSGTQNLGWNETAFNNVNPASDDTNKHGYTYLLDQIVWNDKPDTAGFLGWLCTSQGTAGTLAGVSFTSTVGSNILSITTNNATTKLQVGERISLAGWEYHQVTAINNVSSVTMDASANVALTNNALSFVSPIFIPFGIENVNSTYTDLGAIPSAGLSKYCTDCTTTPVCAAGGSGHMAVSNGTDWTCQ